jgi:hypothetical protein
MLPKYTFITRCVWIWHILCVDSFNRMLLHYSLTCFTRVCAVWVFPCQSISRLYLKFHRTVAAIQILKYFVCKLTILKRHFSPHVCRCVGFLCICVCRCMLLLFFLIHSHPFSVVCDRQQVLVLRPVAVEHLATVSAVLRAQGVCDFDFNTEVSNCLYHLFCYVAR